MNEFDPMFVPRKSFFMVEPDMFRGQSVPVGVQEKNEFGWKSDIKILVFQKEEKLGVKEPTYFVYFCFFLSPVCARALGVKIGGKR